MNIALNLVFFPSSKSPQANDKIIKKILSQLGKECEGLPVNWRDWEVEVLIPCESWEAGVYKAIKLCQSLGRQWIIMGNIDFEYNAWTNHSTVIGVESIEASLNNAANQ